MNGYQEFYLSKVGNNYDQYMLVGIREDGTDDTIAAYNNLYYAELAASFLNKMIEENECPYCNGGGCFNCDPAFYMFYEEE